MNAGTRNDDRAASLADVLATAELSRRVARPPNYRVEAQAMAILAQTLADRPEDILHVLVRTAVELCGEGTCGISLLESNGDDAVFRWVALAGVCEKYAGGCTPRNHSPCGVTLDRSAPQLFREPGRYFTYLAAVEPPIMEGLVIPFFHGEESFGTIWIVSHDAQRRFDDEDVRIMTRLGAFTSAGLQTVRSLKLANKAREDLLLLADLRARLTYDINLESLGQTALPAIAKHVLGDRCGLLRLDETAQQVTVLSDWCESEQKSFRGKHATGSFGEAAFWRSVRTGALAVHDVRQDARFCGGSEGLEQWNLISFATVPCPSPVGTTLLLWVGSRRPRDWTADELNLLQAAATHIVACTDLARQI